MLLKKLNKVFANYLIDNNLTRSDFCKQNNITRCTLNNWLSGRTKPKVDVAVRIQKNTNGSITIYDFCADE